MDDARPVARDAQRHNLPAQFTSFIGRERECTEVGQLLGTTRLLTLVGAGGVGKTRLALRVAADLSATYPDGVWLVELASFADPALVPSAVAAALGVREEPGRSLAATLADFVRRRTLLLVLDNCEHLVDACARLADGLLHACPGLTILATSREPLGIGGETVRRVPSLAAPGEKRLAGSSDGPSILLQHDATHLFIERARAADGAFEVTDWNAATVARICRHLDGIPLAIELAAARTKVLTVEQIAARLDDRFRLVSGGGRTAPPRQQTLRATLDWSHDLLDEPERILLRRLTVFAGGWTLEAAEDVCAGGVLGPADILDGLALLVDKSLVSSETLGDRARYRTLETIHAYAREKLEGSPEAGHVRRGHAAWFLALAERAESGLQGMDQGVWLDQLEAELDNLRVALRWTIQRGETQLALRLGLLLRSFWRVRGYRAEGIDRLTELLALPGTSDHPAERAMVLYGLGILTYGGGDFSASRSFHAESLAVSRHLGDSAGVFRALAGLGYVATTRGEYEQARVLHQEALAVAHEANDRRGVMYALGSLGWVAQSQGHHAEARTHLEQSVAIGRELGDARGLARSLSSLGYSAHVEGDLASARCYDEESLAIRRELGDGWGIALSLLHVGWLEVDVGNLSGGRAFLAESLTTANELGDAPLIGDALDIFAKLALAVGNPETAARLLATADALRERIGAPTSPSDRADFDADVAAARTALGVRAFGAAWAAGRATPVERAIEDALAIEVAEKPGGSGSWHQAAIPESPLSRREWEVAALVARADQPPDRRRAGDQRAHGRRPRRQHPLEARRRQPRPARRLGRPAGVGRVGRGLTQAVVHGSRRARTPLLRMVYR